MMFIIFHFPQVPLETLSRLTQLILFIREKMARTNLTDQKTVEPAESKLKKFKSLILYMLCNGLWCSSNVSTASDYI
jgi:hypothetical protein